MITTRRTIRGAIWARQKDSKLPQPTGRRICSSQLGRTRSACSRSRRLLRSTCRRLKSKRRRWGTSTDKVEFKNKLSSRLNHTKAKKGRSHCINKLLKIGNSLKKARLLVLSWVNLTTRDLAPTTSSTTTYPHQQRIWIINQSSNSSMTCLSTHSLCKDFKRQVT